MVLFLFASFGFDLCFDWLDLMRFLLCDFELGGLFGLWVVTVVGVLICLVWYCFVLWFWVVWVIWFVICGFGSCFDWFGLVSFLLCHFGWCGLFAWFTL